MKKIFVVLILLIVIIGGIFFVIKLNSGKGGVIPQQPGQTSKQEKEVTLYYANEKYAQTGDESQAEVLPVKKKITYSPELLYAAILNELKNEPNVEGLKTKIPSDAKLIGVEVKDGIAYVNYEGGFMGGSLTETLMIDQIVYTFTEIEGIKGVQFLLDGNKAETLMGHADITKPFYRVIEIKTSELDINGMKLNVKRQEFVKTYGNPLKATLSKNKRKELLEYPDFKAIISNGVIYEISTTSDKKQTPSGIKVGTDKQKVVDIYGEASSIMSSADGSVEKYIYQINAEGLMDIELTNGKVSLIGIRKIE